MEKAQTEAEIQKEILDYLTNHNICHFRINTQGIKHTLKNKSFYKKNPNKGMADILVLMDDGNIWIEVKTEKGKLSEEQEVFRDVVERRNNHYLVARSLENVENYMNYIYTRHNDGY